MDDPLISVGALHALVYCERLFYLEEVERIRIADASVFAGRRLHVELGEDDSDSERQTFESQSVGLRGTVDVLRRRDGRLIPYEHKRGRSAGSPGRREAWRTDRVQVGAYALLVEDAHACRVEEGRVRYHADGVTVRVSIDEELRADVAGAIRRARELRATVERPPVTTNERLCVRCSLAPVCLPEEARAAIDEETVPLRLLPPHPDGQTIHVLESGAQVGRSGDQLVIHQREKEDARLPVADVGHVVLHGMAQITTQAIRLCSERSIGVTWVTAGGTQVASLAPSAPAAQRHLRQFAALTQHEVALGLARRLVVAKLEAQLRYLLRGTRELDTRPPQIESSCGTLRESLRRAAHAEDASSLLGYEGSGAAAYFEALPALLSGDLDARFRFDGRNRQPPKDRVNALLGYGYGMLYREVLQAVVAVGLHPGVGFYHRPRSAAHTLVLDVMELFRVPLIDMAFVAALNRRTFHAANDFNEVPGRVLLSESGRKKAIEVIERRKADTWRHSVVGYSLSYARLIELEVRLLEKEWLGEGGLFGQFRLR
jgi:CRISPR-associated protein Cas1